MEIVVELMRLPPFRLTWECVKRRRKLQRSKNLFSLHKSRSLSALLKGGHCGQDSFDRRLRCCLLHLNGLSIRITSEAYLPVGKLAAVLLPGFTALRPTRMGIDSWPHGLVAATCNWVSLSLQNPQSFQSCRGVGEFGNYLGRRTKGR